jgi:hypothetical protein
VGFVVYAAHECSASIFIVDHKEKGRRMVENFEDRYVIIFRAAGNVNKDALSNLTRQSSFHFLLNNMKINILLTICKQILLLNSRTIISHF